MNPVPHDPHATLRLDDVAYESTADGSRAPALGGRLTPQGYVLPGAAAPDPDALAEAVAAASAMADRLREAHTVSDALTPYAAFVLRTPMSPADLEARVAEWLGVLPPPPGFDGAPVETHVVPASGFRPRQILSEEGTASPEILAAATAAAARFETLADRLDVWVHSSPTHALLLSLGRTPGGLWAGVATHTVRPGWTWMDQFLSGTLPAEPQQTDAEALGLRAVAYHDGAGWTPALSGRLGPRGDYRTGAPKKPSAAMDEARAAAAHIAEALAGMTEASDTDVPYVAFVLPAKLSPGQLEATALAWLGVLPPPPTDDLGPAIVSVVPSRFRLLERLEEHEADGDVEGVYDDDEAEAVREAAARFATLAYGRTVEVSASRIHTLVLDLGRTPGGFWAGVATRRVDT